jgi:hypothetical protein
MPGENPDTRIKPLALANSHGRYMAFTSERARVSVGIRPLRIYSIKPLYIYSSFASGAATARKGCFASETAVRRLQK